MWDDATVDTVTDTHCNEATTWVATKSSGRTIFGGLWGAVHWELSGNSFWWSFDGTTFFFLFPEGWILWHSTKQMPIDAQPFNHSSIHPELKMIWLISHVNTSSCTTLVFDMEGFEFPALFHQVSYHLSSWTCNFPSLKSWFGHLFYQDFSWSGTDVTWWSSSIMQDRSRISFCGEFLLFWSSHTGWASQALSHGVVTHQKVQYLIMLTFSKY